MRFLDSYSQNKTGAGMVVGVVVDKVAGERRTFARTVSGMTPKPLLCKLCMGQSAGHCYVGCIWGLQILIEPFYEISGWHVGIQVNVDYLLLLPVSVPVL